MLADRPSIQASDLARAAGISRQAAHYHLRKLLDQGVLRRAGAGRGTRYLRAGGSGGGSGGGPALHRLTYDRAGLGEDHVWDDVCALPPVASLTQQALRIAEYALTELVNNAIDHSEGSTVTVSVAVPAEAIALEVADDGIGIFDNVRRGLHLASRLEAVQELHKGKTTTLPDRHSGEGIFFVSKAVALLEIDSGGLRWLVDNRRDDMAVIESEPRQGTLARVEVPRSPRRPLRAVFDEYTDDFELSRTRTVVRLFAVGVRFVSRSEAKRLLRGLDRFSEVILDFAGVRGIGQGFADEVFRVWASAHPQTKLVPVNRCEPVDFMVQRAVRSPR